TRVDALTRLAGDDVAAVRVAAVQAAATRRAPELVPLLVRALGRSDTEQAASRALIELGPAIEPALFAAIDDDALDLVVRCRVPAVVAVAGQQSALDGLVARLDAPAKEIAIACAKAAGKLRRRSDALRIDEARVSRLIDHELSTAYQVLATLEDLGLPSGSLLVDALSSRQRASLQLVFRLLGLRYTPKTLQLVWLNLDADDKVVRANAIELLDTLLAKPDSRLLLPLLEDRPIAQKLELARAAFAIERRSAEAWLRALFDHPHPWVAACALHAASAAARGTFGREVEAKLAHSDAVVRETARWALDRLT
ncbi:hypothetical protein L6R52_36710, partial [Myxococcota bacterium]|nr:hypothetical protein [Myxococcota bacterium]